MADLATGSHEVGAVATVAVVCWNTRELLRRCLDSLAPGVRRGQIEVVVVDNGSTDGSPEVVVERFPWATLLRAESNLGFGPAANRGLAGAATEWVAPANADIELPPGALEHLLEVGEADRRIGAVAPRLELPDGTTQDSVYAFPRLWGTIAANLGLPRLSNRLADRLRHGPGWDPLSEGEVEWAMGAFLLVRRRAFESVGGFDPDQWMYAEDLDLCWRLRNAGWSTVYAPAATIRHAGGASAGVAFGDPVGTPQVVGASYRWLKRRRGPVTMWVTAGVVIAGGLARLAIYGALGALGSGRAVAGRKRVAEWVRLNLAGVRAER